MKTTALLLLTVAACIGAVAGVNVTFTNTGPRLDKVGVVCNRESHLGVNKSSWKNRHKQA